MTDHKAEALNVIAEYESLTVPGKFALAQVHATLYLAEQQRVANVIAMARAEVECGLRFSDEDRELLENHD